MRPRLHDRPTRWALAAGVAALLAPALAAADTTAVATARLDVDGDGDADEVALEARGAIVVRIDGKAGDSFDRFEVEGTPTGATFVAAMLGGKRRILVTARFASGVGQAFVLRYERGHLFGDWQGPVGPVGRDGDHSVTVAIEDGVLYRYQVRPGVERCDGKPARLFAEAWDGKAFRAVRLAHEVADDAPALTATRQAPDAAPTTSTSYRAQAASSQAGATDAGQLGRPAELDDGDVATVWTETRGKDGRGEFITYRSRQRGARLAGFRIVGGDARSAKQARARNRPARLGVVTATEAWWIDLPDVTGDDAAVREAWWVMLPAAVATDCVTVVLGAAHAGRGKGDVTAISELVALGEADVAAGGAEPKLVRDVIAGGIEADSATKLLARRGAGAARAVEHALADQAATLTAAARGRLLRALAAIADAGSGPVMAAALIGERLTDETIDALADGLVRIGAAGLDELARIAGAAKASDGARLAALVRLPIDHRAAMLGALRGARVVRRAAALRLAEAPAAWLTEQITAAIADGEAAREADLWRALGLAAVRGDDALRASATEAIAARAGAVDDYERRYRLIEALAALDDAGAVRALRGLVAALPAGGGEPAALRQVAAAGLARLRADGAAALLADLAADDDPGVRLAALGALAGRDDLAGDGPWAAGASPDAVDRVLASAVAADTWPEVRRAAAAALGAACPRHGPVRALEAAADRDADPLVRADALTALVQCGAPQIGERLFAVARAKDAPPALRTHAISLLAMLGDPRLIDGLITAFERWRNEAFSDEAALAAARQAANTLGVLGALADAATAARAADALLAAARDGAFPELQAAAVAGLGELGARCPATARALIAELAGSEQIAVKRAAERARAMCGK